MILMLITRGVNLAVVSVLQLASGNIFAYLLLTINLLTIKHLSSLWILTSVTFDKIPECYLTSQSKLTTIVGFFIPPFQLSSVFSCPVSDYLYQISFLLIIWHLIKNVIPNHNLCLKRKKAVLALVQKKGTLYLS